MSHASSRPGTSVPGPGANLHAAIGNAFRHWERLVRFAMVGLSGTAVNIAALLVLVRMYRWPHLPSAGLATEAATLNNFLWNDRWTFRDTPRSRNAVQRAGLYHLATLGGVLVALAIFACAEKWLSWNYFLADALGIASGMAFNYVTNCRFTWPSPMGGRQ